MKKRGLIGLLAAIILLTCAVTLTPLRNLLPGPAKYAGPPLPPNTIPIPHDRTLAWKSSSALARRVYRSFAERPLKDAQRTGKGDGTRILLGHLLARDHVEETNQVILSLKPWGVAGTSGWQNPKGDYDFEEAVYTIILWLFGHDSAVLSPEARDHLLNVMLTEEGGGFRTSAPNTLGLHEETENHMLMTEGSRYLKNRWLALQGNASPRYDNMANGMEGHLIALLRQMRTAGFHEFNSQPYIGYTLLGLLNLEAFASEGVRAAAREDLDYMNWCYALGSYRLHSFPPFRRRYEYAGMTSLTGGYQTAYMNAWLSYAPQPLDLPELQRGGLTHSIIGACLPYRPPDAVVRLLFDKGAGYFVRLGHGAGASPEIYSAGRGYLLSAGGVNRGESSILVARPITLLGDYEGDSLDSVFHLAGPGRNFREWNNTGVSRNFACAAGPVHVPPNQASLAQDALWRIYSPSAGLLVAVHSTPDTGVISVFAASDAKALLASVSEANPDAAALRHSFVFPGGRTLTYDLQSPKDTWVMISDGGRALDRAFDRWPLVGGEM